MHIFELEKSNIFDMYDSLFDAKDSRYIKTDVAKDDWKTLVEFNNNTIRRTYSALPSSDPMNTMYLYIPLQCAVSEALYAKFSKELNKICKEEHKEKGWQSRYNRDVSSYESVFCIKVTSQILAGKKEARITFVSGFAQVWHKTPTIYEGYSKDEMRNFVPTEVEFSYSYDIELPDFNRFVDCEFKHTTYGAIEIATKNRIAERELSRLLESGKTDDYYDYGEYLMKMFKFI